MEQNGRRLSNQKSNMKIRIFLLLLSQLLNGESRQNSSLKYSARLKYSSQSANKPHDAIWCQLLNM